MSLLRAKSRLRRLRYVRDCGHSGVAAPRLNGNRLVLLPRCLKIRGIVPEGNTLGVLHQRARWFAMTERFLTAPSFLPGWGDSNHPMQRSGGPLPIAGWTAMAP